MSTEVILDENLDGNAGMPGTHNVASTGIRFAEYLVDAIIMYVVNLVIASGLGLDETDVLSGILVNIVTIFVYYTIMEGTTAKTIGKMVTGTEVVMEDGSKPSMSTCFVRSLCRIVPFEPFSAFTSNKRMWHDSWTKTWVVKKK